MLSTAMVASATSKPLPAGEESWSIRPAREKPLMLRYDCAALTAFFCGPVKLGADVFAVGVLGADAGAWATGEGGAACAGALPDRDSSSFARDAVADMKQSLATSRAMDPPSGSA